MESVVFIAKKGIVYAPQHVHDPNSRISREELSDDVFEALQDGQVLSYDFDVDNWLEHPAYIATVDGDFRTLKRFLDAVGYQIVEIPII